MCVAVVVEHILTSSAAGSRNRAGGLFRGKVTHDPFNRSDRGLVTLRSFFSTISLYWPKSHPSAMNGHASDPPDPQSLLHSSDKFADGAADTTGAGSASISDSQSPLQDSSPSIDQNLASVNPATISSREPLVSELQDAIPSVGTQEQVAPTAEVVGNGQDTGGGTTEGEAAQAEPITNSHEAEVHLEAVNGQIELLEHTPENNVVAGDGGLLLQDDGQDWIPDPDHELKRVKVCKNLYFVFL